MKIHSTAIISKTVELASDVSIGPFSVITGRVRIDSGTRIENGVTIGSDYGVVEIGKDNHFLSGAVIGGPPQDLSYKGDSTKLIIGDKNIIREFSTINCGTVKGGGTTSIGNECMFMAYVHVAHDCQFGNNVVVANSTQFAGHVEVEDYVRIGGMVGITQFVRIGKFAYIGGGAEINKDILPFSIAEGSWAKARAANKVGMTRAGFSKDEVENIYRALRAIIMGHRTIDQAIKKIQDDCKLSSQIQYIIDFVKSSENGIAR
ncbi:MAG: acyl-[acyl-carrier-protein]--UDP-N-acetylglucosamine O-acyltransferase [Bdellovibrionales bacterium RBG_16_40_8]|nr:MAG: acyl-[acyl-carrier-protein]--UDP-N-acetylglucosamine O-acyltransferase [Bdellovibrionales bacterium RBG_16_40_8]